MQTATDPSLASGLSSPGAGALSPGSLSVAEASGSNQSVFRSSRREQLLGAIEVVLCNVGDALLAKDLALEAEAKRLAEWDRLEAELAGVQE